MIQSIKNELLKQGITIETEADLVNYFNGNFKNVLTFCKEHNIEIVIDEKELSFIERLSAGYNGKRTGVINSLNEIVLVRKIDYIPKDDKLVSSAKEAPIKKEISVLIDGEKKEKVIEKPGRHSTIHFCMNKGVESGSSGNWDDQDVVVIQPMNEKLYDEAVGLLPADTFFDGEVNLEDHIIICNDREKYEIAKNNNPGATVIYSKVGNIANRVICAMGYDDTFYKIACQTTDQTYKKHEDMYSEKLKKMYPKLIDRCVDVQFFLTHTANHNIQTTIEEICRRQLLMSETSPSKSFDEVIDELQKYKRDSFPLNPPFMDAVYPDRYTYSWEKHFPEGYKHIGKLMDAIKTMDPLDPEAIWQLITEDVEITEENKIPLIRLKAMCLKSVNEYNRKFYDKVENETKDAATVGIDITEEEAKKRAFSRKDYRESVYRLMLYSEVAHNKSMLKRQVESDFEKIELEVEDYDYSKFLEKGKELGVITDPMIITNFMAENQKEIVERTSLKESEEEKEILEFIQKKKKSSPKSAEEVNEFFKKYLEEKGLECDEETLYYLSFFELAPNIDRRQALGYQLLYIQNNTKKKEQEIQQQEKQEEDKKQVRVLYDKKVGELDLGGEKTLDGLTKEEVEMMKRGINQVQEQEEVQSRGM